MQHGVMPRCSMTEQPFGVLVEGLVELFEARALDAPPDHSVISCIGAVGPWLCGRPCFCVPDVERSLIVRVAGSYAGPYVGYHLRPVRTASRVQAKPVVQQPN